VVSREFGCHANAELDHGVIISEVNTVIGYWPGRIVHTHHIDGRTGKVIAWGGDVKNLGQRFANGRDKMVFVVLDVLAVACVESNTKILLRFDGVYAGRCIK